jgi:poly(hydroxyalkanoate) depolymerase family esterase
MEKSKVGIIFILILLIFFSACRKRKYLTDKTYWNEFETTENPGNLKFFTYIPENAFENCALVVALHGCTQNAEEFAYTAGWNDLADKYGFIVLYPQQKSSNNVSRCFNWFLKNNIERDKGEVASIAHAINELKTDFLFDETRVFATGVSAGGAMTSVLLACYPDIFSSGAILAGGPYKAATNFTQSSKAMKGKIEKTSEEWSNLFKSGYKNFTGNYPTLTIVHGTSDDVVSIKNAYFLEKQFAAVHQISETPLMTNNFETDDVTLRYFLNAQNDTIIQTFLISGLGHQVPIYPGNGEKQGGNTAKYAEDVGFFSTYWIAKFFKII